jgi:hypothetical protein
MLQRLAFPIFGLSCHAAPIHFDFVVAIVTPREVDVFRRYLAFTVVVAAFRLNVHFVADVSGAGIAAERFDDRRHLAHVVLTEVHTSAWNRVHSFFWENHSKISTVVSRISKIASV